MRWVTSRRAGRSVSRLGYRAVGLGLVSVLATASCGDPTDDSRATGIPPQDPALVTNGAVLYEANCVECHGSDLRGTDQGPSHLSEVYRPGHHGDAAFLLAVLRGSPQHHWSFGDMLPVAGLTEGDVAAIVAYVRETQRVEGFEPYPP